MKKSIAFIDTEVGIDSRINDFGAVRSDRATFHGASVRDFCAFISGVEFLCGHNIVNHDMKYFKPHIAGGITEKCIDTVYDRLKVIHFGHK